jgi:MFS family permease
MTDVGTEQAPATGRLRRAIAPLNAAGFVTAFGAHSVAAGLGVENHNLGFSLLTFGVLLAIYDVAEVILKPIFGALSDRIGVKPVIIGGLIGFAVMSLAGIFASNLLLIGIARLGQGASASAFSPASSSAVARMAGPASAGRFFGLYGSWKSLGYAFGPIIAGVLIGTAGFSVLFIVLAVAAAGTALWVAISTPGLPVISHQRYSVRDLARQLGDRTFLLPVAALAVASGALGVAVGFLPLAGSRLGLPALISVGAVTLMAISSAIAQPIVGRLRDAGTLRARPWMAAGLGIIAAGVAIEVFFPSVIVLYVVALLFGCGIGLTTTIGFSQLASTTPPERMGRTMGTAELGREIGDAGGPLVVGAVATGAGLAIGLGVFGAVATIVAVLVGVLRSEHAGHRERA